MREPPILTQPPSPQDHLLQSKLIEEIASQSARMDDLARQLITLELGLSGIYATVLKLVAGSQGIVSTSLWLYLAFVCWALALALSLISLLPRSYEIDLSRLFAEDANADAPLSIEGYFRRSALDKRRLLIPSSGLFFVGICCAAITVL